jgi:hypothetical protein
MKIFVRFVAALTAALIAIPAAIVGIIVAPIRLGFDAGYEIASDWLYKIGDEARARHEKRQKEKKS